MFQPEHKTETNIISQSFRWTNFVSNHPPFFKRGGMNISKGWVGEGTKKKSSGQKGRGGRKYKICRGDRIVSFYLLTISWSGNS